MAVEEDVDAALDDILGDVISEAESGTAEKAVENKPVVSPINTYLQCIIQGWL